MTQLVLLFMPTCCIRRGVANQVQLSAYPDCIGGGLADLSKFLRKHVDGEHQRPQLSTTLR
jgi:hypothetical protein